MSDMNEQAKAAIRLALAKWHGDQADRRPAEEAILEALAPFLGGQVLDTVLQEENVRLRELLSQKLVDSTMLTGITMNRGGLDIGLEGGACHLLAEMFAEQFRSTGAVNFLEVRLTSPDPEIGELLVTLQKVKGKTPAMLKAEVERTARERLALCYDGHAVYTEVHAEGRANRTSPENVSDTLDALVRVYQKAGLL